MSSAAGQTAPAALPNKSGLRRIAMWSGPRNISTAMMRAWENRPDTTVMDEPFYAFYLRQTGKEHPGAAEIMAHGEIDWRNVVQDLTHGPRPGCAIIYQKQMTHHLLPEVDRSWLGTVTNCFLIRDPREVIVSYMKRNGDPAVEDIGFVQQAEIFDTVRQLTGKTPPVIDARDVLQNPGKTLLSLCEAVGVDFDQTMLQWPAGPRDSDGVWARYWYDSVVTSTSFQPYRASSESVPERLREVEEQARGIYETLYQYRLC
jgi:hypothetical protein